MLLHAPYGMISEAHGFSRSLWGHLLALGVHLDGGGYLLLLRCHLPTLPSLRLQTLGRDSVCILTLPQLSSGPSPPFDLSALLQKELFIAKMMQNL